MEDEDRQAGRVLYGEFPSSAALHKRGWMSDVWKSGRECGPRAAEDHNFTWRVRERALQTNAAEMVSAQRTRGMAGKLVLAF